MKKNNLLKTVLWFVFVLLMMQSCREESTVIENQNLKSKIKINRITKEQFDKNENLKINLDKFLSKKSKPKTSASREIYNEYYDFTILTDNISEVDNGGTKSYTFEIKRSNNINHNILENLMMYPEKEGYQFALVQYNLTSEDFYNFKRGKKIDLKEKVKITKLESNKISLSARLFSCLKTYTTWVPYDPDAVPRYIYYADGSYKIDTDGHYEYVTILGVCDDGATGFTGQTSGSTVPTYSGGHPTVGENYLEYNDLVNKMYTDTNLTTKITEIEKKWLNNNLEDWYIDRDMFRDYLTYNYFEGGTSIAKLQACVFVAKTAALLNLSTSTDWETQVLPFLNFTYNFKIQNPNTSWTQFQNWFMGESEGQDGEYDATYWENPNLTFPAQNLPSWTAFETAFPKDTDPLYDTPEKMYSSLGGTIATFYSGPKTNTCAVRLSKALNYSGVKIPHIPGKTFIGKDGKYYFKAAYEINLWMRKTFGTNPKTSTTPYNPNHFEISGIEAGQNGGNLPNLLKGKKGIYSIYSSDFNWASGHADMLYDNSNCANNCHFGDAPIFRLDVWILN